MHHKKELSLKEFLARFLTEESCEEYLFQRSGRLGLSAQYAAVVNFTISKAANCISASIAVTRAPSQPTPSCTGRTNL